MGCIIRQNNRKNKTMEFIEIQDIESLEDLTEQKNLYLVNGKLILGTLYYEDKGMPPYYYILDTKYESTEVTLDDITGYFNLAK
jgi:predicted ribosome-associated RNA-binding protein Tma20